MTAPQPSPVLNWSTPTMATVERRARRAEIALGLWSAIAATAIFLFSGYAYGHDLNSNGVVVLGGRPSGCPPRYCGCGLRKHLGIDDASLNLAWNWAKKFRRTVAREGAAAVRRGHVMLLQSHVGGTRWIVRDYNGGRGLS